MVAFQSKGEYIEIEDIYIKCWNPNRCLLCQKGFLIFSKPRKTRNQHRLGYRPQRSSTSRCTAYLTHNIIHMHFFPPTTSCASMSICSRPPFAISGIEADPVFSRRARTKVNFLPLFANKKQSVYETHVDLKSLKGSI